VTPDSALRLLSEVRDVQIVDCNGVHCGIVDNIELGGTPGGKMQILALLVGPGAYVGRVPNWLINIVSLFVGRRIKKIPWSAVAHIADVIELSVTGDTFGLTEGDKKARKYLPKVPAL
jgi:hypothetical protein